MFRTPLRLEATRPGEWALVSKLVWDDHKERIVVPAGSATDLASIPRPLRGILNQNGRSRRAAVLHDYLYRQGIVPRAGADAVFRRALGADGMSWLGRLTYWAGVRLGGWIVWRSRRKG